MKNLILGIILYSSIVAVAVNFIGCKAYQEKRAEKKLAKLELSHPELFVIKNTDSTYKPKYSETKSVDTLYIQGQAQTFTVSVPCPQTAYMNGKAKGKHGYTPVTLSKGIFTFKCPQDSLMEIITNIRDSVRILEVKNTSGLAKTIVTVTAPLTGWQEFCKYFTDILLIVAACYFGGKYGLPLILKAIKGGI